MQLKPLQSVSNLIYDNNKLISVQVYVYFCWSINIVCLTMCQDKV